MSFILDLYYSLNYILYQLISILILTNYWVGITVVAWFRHIIDCSSNRNLPHIHNMETTHSFSYLGYRFIFFKAIYLMFSTYTLGWIGLNSFYWPYFSTLFVCAVVLLLICNFITVVHIITGKISFASYKCCIIRMVEMIDNYRC